MKSHDFIYLKFLKNYRLHNNNKIFTLFSSIRNSNALRSLRNVVKYACSSTAPTYMGKYTVIRKSVLVL